MKLFLHQVSAALNSSLFLFFFNKEVSEFALVITLLLYFLLLFTLKLVNSKESYGKESKEIEETAWKRVWKTWSFQVSSFINIPSLETTSVLFVSIYDFKELKYTGNNQELL